MIDQMRPPFPPFTHDAAITKVRKAEDAWNTEQVFVLGYESLRQRLVHKSPGARQFLGGQIGSILEEISYPFLMDFGRPLGAE